MTETQSTIGVLGGSGLYQMAGLSVLEEIDLETPFGPPSDRYVRGRLAGREVIFLPRHGRGHRLLPSELNFRANIWGFKKLGVDAILSVSAVGSMQERYRPTDVVVPDQFIDRTRHRPDTFFGSGLVAHIAFADPVCPTLVDVLARAGVAAGASLHRGGTYLCMEGPQFSTRAESFLYRSWGVDVIGMTNLQEAKLAREAEICYATLAMVTDYDCWHDSHESVTAEAILAVLASNVTMAQEVIRHAVGAIGHARGCACRDALKIALVTDPALVPEATLRALAPIVGRYLPVPVEEAL